MRTKSRYEILNHGYDHSQYFPGCGTAFSDYDHVVTGCGDNAKEAYEDAVEQVYQCESQEFADALKLPKRPRGINAKDKVPAKYLKDEENELYWYVSIRY